MDALLPKIKRYLGTCVAVVADCIGATLLFLYALVIGPLGFLRGPLVLERAFWYLWVLAPLGALTRSFRVAIDWRLGHFDAAIAQAEGLITSVERYCQAKPQSRIRRRVLEDLYSVLTRAYLHVGHIDEGMQVIIRAKRSLNVDRLPGLADVDVKTAHLVRAGVAAGRLIEGGGLATMFVKTEMRPAETAQSVEPQRRTAAKAKQEAKIIPFPTGDVLV